MSAKTVKFVVGCLLIGFVVLAGLWVVTSNLHKAEDDLDTPSPSAPHVGAKSK